MTPTTRKQAIKLIAAQRRQEGLFIPWWCLPLMFIAFSAAAVYSSGFIRWMAAIFASAQILYMFQLVLDYRNLRPRYKPRHATNS